MLSNDELSEELRAALAFALQPIGNSLLQLKKRSRLRPGRPSKLGEVRDSFEVRVIPKEVEYEKSKLLWERPRQAAGMSPKPIKAGDAIKNVDEKRKISRAKVYKLIKRRRAIADKSLENNNK